LSQNDKAFRPPFIERLSLLKNFLFLLFGIIIGLLLTDRSRAIPVPTAPRRRSRTLEELAPISKTSPDSVGAFETLDKYLEYMKALIDQLVQEGLTEKEAYIAAEHLKFELPFLGDWEHQLDIHRRLLRHNDVERWVQEVEEAFDDEEDEGNGG
jgi:hypothetical protein